MGNLRRAIELGSRAFSAGCWIGGLGLDGDHPVRSPDSFTRDGTGRILSRRAPFFPMLSHFSLSKADISPDSKLKGCSLDVVGRNFFECCIILCRFVPSSLFRPVCGLPNGHAVSRNRPGAVWQERALNIWYGGVTRLGKRQMSSVVKKRRP